MVEILEALYNERRLIDHTLTSIRSILVFAGIDGEQVKLKSGNYKNQTIKKMALWLGKLITSDEYQALANTYLLLHPDIWTRYDHLSIVDTQEQILREERSGPLRALWRTDRPKMIGASRASTED